MRLRWRLRELERRTNANRLSREDWTAFLAGLSTEDLDQVIANLRIATGKLPHLEGRAPHLQDVAALIQRDPRTLTDAELDLVIVALSGDLPDYDQLSDAELEALLTETEERPCATII